MEAIAHLLNRAVTALGVAILALTLWAAPVVAQGGAAAPETAAPAPDRTEPSGEVDRLLADLARPDNTGWRRTEREIIREWSKSGSPAMDLLLQRGREALRQGDTTAAIEHLTALTDHAPGFAEGWNARATAFFQSGQYGPAVEDIARTLALNPRHFGALAGLGAILGETGDKLRSLAVFRAALSIHPHQESLKQAVTRLLVETGGQDL